MKFWPATRFSVLAFFLLLLIQVSPAQPTTSEGRFHALRLRPGQDLKVELTRYLEKHDLRAAAIVTCVGSLTVAHLRYAQRSEGRQVEGPLEIQSLVGTGGGQTWHLHLSVADQDGQMFGGHLLEGSIVRTTAEIVLVELNELDFERSLDPASGYKELEIRRRPAKGGATAPSE